MLTDEPVRSAHSVRRFLAQLTHSAGMRFLAAGLTFALVPVCIRTLGVQGFGEYAIAISWMNVLIAVAKLGFDTASLRYVAQYRSQAEPRLLRDFVATSQRLTWGFSLLLAGGMVGVALLMRSRLSDGLFWCLVGAAAMLPLMADIQLREARLLACGRVTAGQLGGVLLPLLLIVLMTAAAPVPGLSLKSTDVMVLNLTGAAMTAGTLCVLSRSVVPRGAASGTAGAPVREWVTVSFPLLLVQVLTLLLVQSGTILCGLLIDERAAGVFSAVARVASVLLLGLQAIGMIAAPTISALYYSSRRTELERFVNRCCLASFVFAATSSLLMVAGGPHLLGLVGREVIAGYWPMTVLLCGLVLASAAGPVNHLLLMTGHQWDCIKVNAIVLVVGLLVGLLVIPAYGVLGAAMMAALTRTGSALALVVYARHRHCLWCTAFPLGVLPEMNPAALRKAA